MSEEQQGRVDFKKGAKLLTELANTYSSFTSKKPKRFIPRGPGWTLRKQVDYAEGLLAEHWEQNKMRAEICRHLSMVCLELDRLQKTLKNSIIG